MRYASVLRTIESLTGRQIEGVHIVGGGSRNDYLNCATAAASGLPVTAGPVEATVIGNVLVQAIAAGRFASLADARRYVGEHAQVKTYEPILKVLAPPDEPDIPCTDWFANRRARSETKRPCSAKKQARTKE